MIVTQAPIEIAQSRIQISLLSGAISGVISRTFVAPIERVIIMQQTKSSYVGQKFFGMLLNMWKNEGTLALFKGNKANCIRIAPFQAIEFSFNDLYKSALSPFFTSQPQLQLLAGALAGATATTIVYPLDLAKTHLAINVDKSSSKKGVFSVIRSIQRETGTRSLYRGLGTSIIGMTPYSSLKLTFNQQLHHFFPVKKGQSKWVENIIFGGMAGCLAVSVTYPTDLIRRKVQVLKMNGNNSASVSTFSVIKNVFQAEGFKGFYQGLPATYIKLFPATALAFAINDELKTMLTKNH